MPSIQNSLYANMIQAISDVLRANGLHLMIANSGHRLEDEEALVSALLAQRVCGLVLHNTTHSKRVRDLVRKTGVPVIETGNLPADPLDMAVSYSNFEAARAMTAASRPARLPQDRLRDLAAARQRPLGGAPPRLFRGAEGARLAGGSALVLEAAGGFSEGADALVRLVQAHPDLDAGFFAGDVLAVGALFECQRRGWAVPGRVAIASFDDLDLLRHAVPAVTTLRIPRQEIGRRSAELLVNRLHGAPPEKRQDRCRLRDRPAREQLREMAC